MTNLESLFHKHVKNFVAVEHENLAVTGYQIDEDGYGLATDGTKLLKMKIAEPGEHKVLTLKGKPFREEVKAPNLGRLIPDYQDAIAIVDVDAWLDAAAALVAVMQAGNEALTLVDLKAEDGELSLTFKLKDETSGSWVIGESKSKENITRCLDGAKLIHCLKVFQGLTGSVELLGTASSVRPLLFKTEDIEVLLMPVRRY